MDEAMQARFEEKFKELLALAKKKKKNNILDYAEIQDALADLELEDEEIDKIKKLKDEKEKELDAEIDVKKKANDETLNSIKEHCQKNLAKYSWPYDYEFRRELPKTLVGKVAYNKLIEEEKSKNEKK